MLGYALAFGVVPIVQALVATGFAVWVCGLDIAGPVWLLVVIALLDALLGTALGLLASGFARTEFQAVQFMPAFVLPQFLLCGLLAAPVTLPSVLDHLGCAAAVVCRGRDEGVTVQRRPAAADVLAGAWIIVSPSWIALVPSPGQPDAAPPHP
jgi:hypothetical protein